MLRAKFVSVAGLRRSALVFDLLAYLLNGKRQACAFVFQNRTALAKRRQQRGIVIFQCRFARGGHGRQFGFDRAARSREFDLRLFQS